MEIDKDNNHRCIGCNQFVAEDHQECLRMHEKEKKCNCQASKFLRNCPKCGNFEDEHMKLIAESAHYNTRA